MDVRMSFRTTRRNFDKITALAQMKGWIRSGSPNVSTAINYILRRFKLPTPKKPRRVEPVTKKKV